MSGAKRLCIVPCGSAKVWDKNPLVGPQKAENVYTGVFARTCQRYARTFFDNWVILSAKHGFLFPNDIVNKTYNVSFVKPSTETIGLDALKDQVQWKGLFEYQEITVLGGKHYVDRVESLFTQTKTILIPLRDCKGIGFMLQRLSNALETKTQMSGRENNTDTNSPVRAAAKETSNANKPLSLMIGKHRSLYDHLRAQEGSMLKLTTE